MSFILASLVAFTALGQDRKPRYAYEPATGRIANVDAYQDGQLKIWLPNERLDLKIDPTGWIFENMALEQPEESVGSSYFVTKAMKRVHSVAEFTDGKLLIVDRDAENRFQVVAPSELTALKRAPRIADHTGILENGEGVRVLGLLQDGRIWVTERGLESGGYFRERAGVVILPDEEEQLESAMEMIDQTISPMFEGFRAMDLDLNDKAQFQLFKLYILTRFYGPSGGTRIVNMKLDDLMRFLAANKIPPKLSLNMVDFKSGSRVLRVRRLDSLEAVFRGCLGQDCSTNTRFFRALEPAHLNFSIEEVPYRGLGQIEIVLGSSADDRGRKLAFLERIQSPKNLRVHELTDLLVTVYSELRAQGYTLVMPRTLKTYIEGHHPIANNPGLERRIDEALEKNFVFGAEHSGFDRDADKLPNEDTRFTNLVAHHLREKDYPVFEIAPKAEVLQDWRSRMKITRAASAPVLPFNYALALARMKSAIHALRNTPESRDQYLKPKFWSKLEGELYTQPCEFKVAPVKTHERPASIH